MDQQSSFLHQNEIDQTGQSLLQTSGKWSNFIGIVYVIMAILMLLLCVGVYISADELVSRIRELAGLSNEAYEFITGAGKVIFLILSLIMVSVITLNGVYLIQFKNKISTFVISGEEHSLRDGFSQLKKYFTLTTILGAISMLISFIASIALVMMM